MRELLQTGLAAGGAHIWWGVSVENRCDGLPGRGPARNARGHPILSVEPVLEDMGPFDLTGIHWVIAGGESGPGARPSKIGSPRSATNARQPASLFSSNKWGGTRKGKTGRVLDGRTHDEIPPRAVRPVLDDDRRKAMVAELLGRAMLGQFPLMSN